ncbi:MFS transporter [Paenibacillus thalictri]|uniref:MFS transporter n=1 Tax=Paenibacillus thalictri TaxID=2527873 RepID=A0A4Q9DJB4_9BACL|nr:MFS transporter [Paenibacillus thalictri]TBL70553.1 MFS transporter [Paenibacillus thalictri]
MEANKALFFRPKRKISDYRRGLWAATMEGFPAIVVLQLLGGPFLTGYLLFLGATSEQIGIVLAVTTLVNIVQLGAAVAMQKIKSRKMTLVLFGSMHRLLWVSTGLIPFVLPQVWWVDAYIVLYFLAFLSNGIGSVVWTSMMGDMVPAAVRGKYIGIRNTIVWAIGGVCIYAGGQILEKYPGAEGFHLIYIICAICTVLNIIAFFFYPNPPFAKSTELDIRGMLRRPFQDAMFRRAVLFLSAYLLVQGLAVPFFNFVMLDVLKLGYSLVSMYTLLMTLVMMVSYYLWGALNSKYSTQLLLLWSLPFIGLSCLLWGGIAFLPALLVLGAVHILLGIGTGGFNLLAFNFIIGDTPKSERPMFIAVYSALTGIAGFIGPLLGGVIFKHAANWPEWLQQYGICAITGLLLLMYAAAGKYVFGKKTA